jgi:hypothetical protein
MSLRDWHRFGWLKEHQTTRLEIAYLFAIADRDLKACRTPALGSDWQFKIGRHHLGDRSGRDVELAEGLHKKAECRTNQRKIY